VAVQARVAEDSADDSAITRSYSARCSRTIRSAEKYPSMLARHSRRSIRSIRAIAAARAAGKRILLAAKIWEAPERQYFAEMVEPLLGDDAVYVGEVGGAHKRELLGGAEALINPIRWNEPFGLVMIESLACGTPVIAFPEGAAPEIVHDGRTGFLCDDEEQMAAAMARVDQLDRRECRASVEGYFSAERMVREHLALYERVIEAASSRNLESSAGA